MQWRIPLGRTRLGWATRNQREVAEPKSEPQYQLQKLFQF